MASTKIELTWVDNDSEEDNEEPDLLARYLREIASGPMTSYRRIIQGGNKQGQNYYAHVLDGITVLHKLRTAEVVEISELEEKLLFGAFTIHDINSGVGTERTFLPRDRCVSLSLSPNCA